MTKRPIFNKWILPILALVVTTLVQADHVYELSKLLDESSTKLNLRYRFEIVDEEGFSKDANASTLRTRLTWKSGKLANWHLNIEIDNVTAFTDNYNSTDNGNTNFPVIADPKGTDINQVNFQYVNDSLTFTAGRQRITHNDQRFVGGVAWRQNEQTFDGYRVEYQINDAFSLDSSYVYNINTIFAPTSSQSNIAGDFLLINSLFKASKDHQFNFYGYLLDFETNTASSQTIGVRYTGQFGPFSVIAAYANQNDYRDNPVSFSNHYYYLDAKYQYGVIKVGIGYEVLGSDKGVAFSTPLATLHKFQGFADKFLVTPDNGVKDLYANISINFPVVSLELSHHGFSSEVGSETLATESDVVMKYNINKHLSGLFKIASYRAHSHQSDTNKVWMMLSYNF